MYVPLYTKSVYSLLKSALKIADYVKYATLENIPSLGLCDIENVYGLIKFYRECKKNNIKPLLGLTVFADKDMPVIFYAKNNEGLANLLKISSYIHLNNQKKSFDKLTPYFKNLICIIPILNTGFEQLLTNNQNLLLVNFIQNLKKLFKGDLFIAIGPENNDNIVALNRIIAHIALSTQAELVALNEINYLKEDDATTLRYLEAIEKGEKLTNNLLLKAELNYFLSVESFSTLFNNYQNALANTIKISEMCNVEIEFNKSRMPKYKIDEGISSDEYLRTLCKKGLEKRLNTTNIDAVYLERLKYELQVINMMNFSDYFLIVYDFVKYAKKNNIAVGPGRGSAAGSLVSYVLGITNVDPIKYNLMFERFLNPERISMPDIDMDFQDTRRDEVIRYVRDKYGIYNVAHIIAFGTFASRSTIREVAKVMGIADMRVSEVLSYIDSGKTIEENLRSSHELSNILAEFPEINRLFTIAKGIEGIPRNTTTHAAGVIISDVELTGVTALQEGVSEVYQTQFEAQDVEALGLLKMDFLGIKNLSTISEILEVIKTNYQIDVDINNLPLDDAKTYRLIARGETTGVFQLESSGMRNLLSEINTSSFEDIVTVNALYRPGPMENIPEYLKRRKEKGNIDYLHKDLIPILSNTYGIIVYQEQVMLIAQRIAGYSLSRADLLRRAISKKQKEVLEKERAIFIESATKNGYDIATATKLIDYIVKFGDYGFNRSHSVAYSVISYQMAYLKANFLTPFMIVLLKSATNSEEQTKRLIGDCKRYGIKVLPVSVNKSNDSYAIENNNSIRMSFLTVKGLGLNTCQLIINERKNGAFRNFYDFIERTKPFLRQNIFEALVYIGALDEFGLTKQTMIKNYEKVLDYIRFNPSGYFTNKIDIIDFEEYQVNVLMEKERELLGFYLNSHPIRKLLDMNPNNSFIVPSVTLKYLDKTIELLGYVESIRKTITKNNEEMAIVVISDDLVSINGVIFPKAYGNIKSKLKKDAIYNIRCMVKENNQKLQLVIFDMVLFG